MKARAAAMLLLFAPALFAQEQRAYLDLFVNDVQRETVLVRLRGEPIEDTLVAVEDLEKAGLHGVAGAREVHEGREYVSLKSLAPQIGFEIDQQALAVRLTARPEMLERQRVDMTRLAGSILTPSTLDLYVNGVLVRQQQLAPGQFEVRNLPVPSGAGQVSYVVRDAFGRTQEFSSPYYATSGVLAEGISEYGYQLGL